MTESVETNVTRIHVNRIYLLLNTVFDSVQVKGKGQVFPLQAWCGPEGG
jgi:hypothetical protein